jgi:hypothetical protein
VDPCQVGEVAGRQLRFQLSLGVDVDVLPVTPAAPGGSGKPARGLDTVG